MYCDTIGTQCNFLRYKSPTDFVSTVDVIRLVAAVVDPTHNAHGRDAQSAISYVRQLGLITKEDLYKKRFTKQEFVELLWQARLIVQSGTS